ncbi:excalibur calcium-binding domain-containing protein [Streptomyces sp. NPDC047434]|uniref:excalibur calcium-binding domain-containing protein n=1 Tax=Streptomyces sp. NPDC047434 TaxID=3155143 RepID=UPI0033DCA4EC
MYPPPPPQSPHPPPAAPARAWWRHPALAVATLVVLPPVGIALTWLGRWSRNRKIVATVLSGLWFLVLLFADPPPADPAADAEPRATASAGAATGGPTARPTPTGPPTFVGRSLEEAKSGARAAGYDSVSHDASDQDAAQWDADGWKVCFQTPADEQPGGRPVLDFGVVRIDALCPAKDGDKVPWPKMPAVTGKTFDEASQVLARTGFRASEPRSAYTDVTLPEDVAAWKVCFQDPRPAEEVQTPQYQTAYLSLTAPATACPPNPNTALRPDTGGTTAGNDEADGSTRDGGTTDGGTTGGGTTGGGGVYYANCAAARAAHAAPIRSGEPGYRAALDRDGDGVACDR